jgi:hypothetical protein
VEDDKKLPNPSGGQVSKKWSSFSKRIHAINNALFF